MKPRQHQILGNTLVVVWDDGHESYYEGEPLRRSCPCAACSGEPDLFGRTSVPYPRRYDSRSFELSSVQSIGHYALQPNWADGHTYGIWTFERLRESCNCDECRSARGGG